MGSSGTGGQGARMSEHDEYLWERLLQAIESGKVVPILGRDALQVDTGDGLRRYDSLVAERLAASLGMPLEGLPAGFDLNDVVCRAANFRGIMPASHNTRIISILQSIKVPTPEVLTRLVRIPKLRLFVSLTFDTLLEEALLGARGRAPAVASFPASTDHADFDPALLESHGSMVFQLLGRRSASAQFAVTEGQTLELLHKVMSSTNRPTRLIDQLRDSHLLLLGIGLPDWPARFLLRMARPGPLWNDRDTDEILAGSAQEGLPTFLHRFSPEHSLTSRISPLEFARELERRWFERFPGDNGRREAAAGVDDAEEAPPEMATGAVFISYAREDRDAAFLLADRLNDAGVDVWVDRRLSPGDAYRRVIERNIVNCGAFIALLSGATQHTDPRWYRREWNLACKQNETYFGTGSNFIVPVIVDRTSAREHAETLSLFGIHGAHAAKAEGGTPDATLVQSLRQSQRQWRKHHAARA
jgi:TIR domain/SIR2-like domain